MDLYYSGQRSAGEGLAIEVARQLSEPKPADRNVTWQLSGHKGLASLWHRWEDVTRACHRLADLMLQGDPPRRRRSAMWGDVSNPVGSWPHEALQAAMERGDISHRRRIAAEIGRSP